jgi:Trk K+ transport system NAD-binding subunit
MIVPHGNTVLDENDRVTVIGESPGLKQLREEFEEGRDRPGFYAAEKGS